jgi:prepilin-type N-terminal cleavage/methylation domain-containing protein
MHGRAKKGFTLVELLIVIAVILVVAAITTPVISRAKYGALLTSDLSNLRQIGQAAEMYHLSYDEWTYSVTPLVENGLVPPKLLSASTDTYPRGIANKAAEVVRERPRPYYPFRNSYISQHDYGVKSTRLQYPGEFPASGWLLLLTEYEPVSTLYVPTLPEFRYLRLCYDGSIVKRPFFRLPTVFQGRAGVYWHPAFLFADGDDAWYASLKSLS